MRTIKFRFLGKDRMIYFDLTDIEYGTIIYGDDIVADLTKVDVMQFTGLKDKNGKEIYKGDILRIINEYDKVNITEVKFIDGGFTVEDDFGEYDMTTIGWAINIWDNENSNYEIIGNIYENPDLLK